MTLATNLDETKVLKYASNVQLAMQQKKNHLEGTVTEVQASGEAMSAADFFTKGDYVYGTANSRTNVETPLQSTRRWLIRPDEIESGQYIETEDQLDMAMDPTSTLVQGHVANVQKGIMDRILGTRKDAEGYLRVTDGGILGNAIEGKRPGTSGTALPASQVVAAGGTGLTIGKLKDTLLALRQADFGMEADDPLYAGISPFQADDLLGIAEASGNSLNAFNIEQLKTGKPTPLMGITWIMSNRIPFKDGTTNTRLVPVWSKANIIAGYWQRLTGVALKDSHAKNKPYINVSARLDCVRAQDGGVVVIECLQS